MYTLAKSIPLLWLIIHHQTPWVHQSSLNQQQKINIPWVHQFHMDSHIELLVTSNGTAKSIRTSAATPLPRCPWPRQMDSSRFHLRNWDFVRSGMGKRLCEIWINMDSMLYIVPICPNYTFVSNPNATEGSKKKQKQNTVSKLFERHWGFKKKNNC